MKKVMQECTNDNTLNEKETHKSRKNDPNNQ